MKRIAISIILLSAIFIFSFSVIFIIGHKNKELTSILSEVQVLTETKQYDKAALKAEELSTTWESYQKIMLLFVKDNKINEINISISKINSFINEQNDKLPEEILNASHSLNYIYKSEIPCWYNIL